VDNSQDLRRFTQDVQKIKNAILQSRYRSASNANAEMLNLYYGVGKYISANTRSGKWGSGAIEMISEQLQGEIPGLKGFSPSNMKNMRIFAEEWSSEMEPNRQTLSAELDDVKMLAFCRVGFSHHREILKRSSTARFKM
jgi:hypothetical protein